MSSVIRNSSAGISDLSSAKNVGRGALTKPAAEARATIGVAFQALVDDERNDYFKWASSVATPKTRLLSIHAPKNWEELTLQGVEGELDFQAQVDWCTRVLQIHTELLTAYVLKRSRIEHLYLSSDFDGALAELDLLEAECGKSFWAIELRVCILQNWKGLEAHKAFASDIQSKHPKSTVSYIASHISQRNEEKTNLTRFVARVTGRRIPPHMKDLADYLLTKIPPAPERRGATLNAASSASPIDAYEALIDLAGTHTRDASTLIPEFLERLHSLLEIDWRLRCLISDRPASNADFRLPHQPAEVGSPETLYRSCVEATGIPIATHSKSLDRFIEITKSIWATGETTSALLAEHEKLIVNHVCISYFKLLSGFYALDAARFGTDSVFNIVQISQALPGTTELGDVLLIGHSILPSPAQDRWSVECNAVVALTAGAPLDNVMDHLEAFSADDAAIWQLRFARLSALTKARVGRFSEAIEIVANFCSNFPGRRFVFPLVEILPGSRWSDISDCRSQIALPIFLSLLHELTGDESVEKLLRTSFKEFHRGAGVDKPSQLASCLDRFPVDQVKYLLREIALTNALDSLGAFRTTRALNEERIAILQTLIELDSANVGDYTNEIKQLTKLLSLADGLSDIDSSRIHVEYQPLLRAAEERFGETFRRYMELRKASVGFGSAEEFEKALREYVRGDAQSFEKYLEYPELEGDALLIEIVNGIVDLFLHDPVHGLDIYLSMRIRHGSLATNLRAPLEARGLHVPEKHSAATNLILEYLPASEQRDATIVLKEFTKRFERAITALVKERLQIRTTPGGHGLFDFSKPHLLFARARSSIEPDTDFSKLFELIFETLAIYLSSNVNNVRAFVQTDFKHEIEKCFDTLRAQLSSYIMPVAQSRIGLAIGQASPDVSATIDRVSQWFAVSGASSGQLRTFDEIVDIALVAVQRAHRTFGPNVVKSIEDLGPQSLVTFNETLDALFPLLENIAEHSGMNSPRVDITVSGGRRFDEDGRLVVIRVESDISGETDCPAAESRLVEIRKLMASGEYKQRVRGEGGTGLLKIHRMVARDDRQSLDFGLTGSQRFYAEFTMALRFISVDKSEQLGLA